MESLSSRVLTSVVGFALLSVIVWIGWVALLPALIVVALMCLFEYIRMLDRNDIDVRRVSLGVFTVAIMIASLPLWPHAPWPGGSWREAVLTVALGYMLVVEVIRPGERPWSASCTRCSGCCTSRG